MVKYRIGGRKRENVGEYRWENINVHNKDMKVVTCKKTSVLVNDWNTWKHT